MKQKTKKTKGKKMPPVAKVGDQNELVATKNYPFANWPFENFNPVQSRVFDYYKDDVNMLIAARTSAGKAQPNDALVLTQHGYRPIASLIVGDEIIGANGKLTRVIGVYPQGIKSVFRVHFSDGTFTECCDEHLWAVRSRGQRSRNVDWKVLSLSQIMEYPFNTLHIPSVGNVEFPVRKLAIDPYVMGILLGDGGVVYGAKVTICDAGILRKFKAKLPAGCKLVHLNKYDYSIVGDGEWNQLLYELSQLNILGLHSYEKHIPWIFKYSSIDQRKQLLQGLMDSDGGYNVGKSPSFDVTSKDLADDMAFLIRSLGGWTKLRVKSRSTYKYKGEKKFSRPVYRLTVGLNFNPFGDTSYKGKLYNKHNRNLGRHPLKKISSIELIGKKECRCIKVENQDGLYVTNDFIVTHNTVVAEMFLAQEIRERGGKGMFLAPLRALAQEKIDQWTDLQYHFKDLKISICTGDYRLTKDRAKELTDADLIIMTSEMLNHRSRNFQAEQNNWMLDIGTLVIDESHLLTVPGRGDHLEVGLMKFTEINPKARIVLLSATMPNVDQIAEWVSYSLTKKQTYVLNSQYRPVPLNVHYEIYENAGRYDAKEESKVEKALEIIGDWYPDDKFLVFAHTKRTGENMKQALRNAGIKADFHNADLDKDQRVKLERDFRNDPKMRVIIATPTLAWGLNLPARRVIILGVHRGLDEIETYNVTQMIGRSGRLGIDPAGDAYILIPDDEEQKWRTKLQKPQNIESQLLNKEGEHHKVLAFHLVSEIHHGYIETTQDVHRWYERSLAYFQNKNLQDTVVDETLELLQKKGAVKFEDNVWKVTSVGMISSMFYFSPFDVADLKNNFWHLFNKNNQDNDYFLAMALANTDTNKMNIVSRAEKDEMSLFANRIRTLMGTKYTYIDPVLKAGYCYFNLLNGNNSAVLAATQRNLQFDYPRVSQVILALDTMAGKWGQLGFLKNLEERIRNGVPSHLVNLCSIPNVGKVRAKKLYDAGIRTVDDFANVPADNLRKLLNLKEDIVKQMLAEATKQSLTSS